MNLSKLQDFKPENFNEITVFTDGGSRGNPGPAAGACVIYDSAGKVRLKCGKYLGTATNNIAEYRGVILAFKEILKFSHPNFEKITIKFNLDSSLVVNQLNGMFKVKDANIREEVVKIREFESNFKSVSYSYIPREKNILADRVVNETLDSHQL